MITVTFAAGFKPHLACMESKNAYGASYKTSVCIDPAGWLVATDGHILIALPCQIDNPTGEAFAGGMIDAADFKTILKAKPKKAATCCLTVDTPLRTVSAGDETVPLSFHRYCDWRRVVPDVSSELPKHALTYGAFDPRLLTRLADAMGIAKDTPIALRFTGPESAAVLTHDGALGLLMPGTNQLAAEARPQIERLFAFITGRPTLAA